MAWNDTKGTGDSLTAAEWNAHVTHQEDVATGHDHDGVDSKKITGTNIEGMTVSRALVSDASGDMVVSATTDTEIGYVSGLSSAVQTQLDTKAPLASPTFTGTTHRSVTDGITAFATGGQASAVALTTDINEIDVSATNGDSVKLPAGVAGMEIIVINNDSAETIDVFPLSGDYINGNLDTALNVASQKQARFTCYKADYWFGSVL